jgi:ribosomal protein S18 acetylase RimI-like enzyme
VTAIRLYDPSRDRPGLERCFVALQEHERTLDPDLLSGKTVVTAYLNQLFSSCALSDGRIFVAEARNAMVGFVAVLAHKLPDAIDTAAKPYAYISDLVVLPEARGEGLGRALLERAESYARKRGAVRIRLHVLAKNAKAAELYEAFGYRDYERELERSLIEPQ